MRYAYDLDGTLADTREAVLTAYRAVGVEPPADFFGLPWKAWLKDAELHAAKNRVYREIAPQYIRPTKLVELYRLTGGIIITGASENAARTVLSALDINSSPEMFCELDMFAKSRVLNEYGEHGIVFEDSPTICAYLKETTQWTVCRVLY